MERKRFVPPWIRRFDDKNLQRNIMLVLGRCKAILRLLSNINGAGDTADLEAARINLKDTLAEMGEPLWPATMAIKPQVLNGRLPTAITEELARSLWALRNEFQDAEDEPKAEFFGKVASRLRGHQISFFRTVIAGGELKIRERNGKLGSHYFPGIHPDIRREAEVRLSTHPDNLWPIITAYQIMAEQSSGHARISIEALIADIKELSQDLYPPQRN